MLEQLSEELENKKSNVENPDKREAGINFVFEKNPEMASIGNRERYFQYLDTIFRESKIKNILYHGGGEDIETFDNTKFNIKLGRDKLKKRFGLGHYFTGDIKYASRFGDQIYNVLLNMTSPKVIIIDGKNYEKFADVGEVDLNQLKIDGYDSLIGIADEKYKDAFPDEYVIFDPEQIRILGSKKDAEEFRKFINDSLAPK